MVKRNFSKKIFIVFFNKEDHRQLKQLFQLALSGQRVTVSMQFNYAVPNHPIVNVSVIPIQENDKVHEVIGIIEDITDQLKVSQLAMEDELTGLPNRRYLMEKLTASLASTTVRKEKLAVLFIDLDRFKLVNDTLGHYLGDQALKLVALRLRDALPDSAIITRVGGDEFVVLLPELENVNEAKQTAEKLLEEIRYPLLIDEYEFTLTGSIGIAIFPECAKDAESLIKSADAALYRAKADGGDANKLFQSEMRFLLHEKFYVENDLRRALERGEFSLYFQPQFDLKTNQYCGEEVLVRWNHPTEGLISPVKFLTVAEETGLIVSIGEWVLREACYQKKKLVNMGFPQVPMSVNLSLRQFLHRDIVKQVEGALHDSCLAPRLLELEVTESVTIDIDRTVNILNRLLALGVKISLDDFGTGYSSLQYVSQLPIQELKIDQSFVRNIGQGKQSEGIISMIINLAHYLEISVIAEGVETEQQLMFLQKQNCNKVQGYYYTKPLCMSDYQKYLRTKII